MTSGRGLEFGSWTFCRRGATLLLYGLAYQFRLHQNYRDKYSRVSGNVCCLGKYRERGYVTVGTVASSSADTHCSFRGTSQSQPTSTAQPSNEATSFTFLMISNLSVISIPARTPG